MIMISENAISTFCKPVSNGQNDFILQNFVALGLRGIKLKMTKNGNFSSIMEVKFPVK